MKFISWFVCHNTTNNPRDHEARSWNAADNALSNCSLIYFSFKHLESLSLNSDTCLATHSSSLIIASTCCCCCCFREVISELNLVFVVGWISRFYFNKINICAPDSTCHRPREIIGCSVSLSVIMNRDASSSVAYRPTYIHIHIHS